MNHGLFFYFTNEYRKTSHMIDESEDNDPRLLAFLDFLEQQIAAHPELIVEADYANLERINETQNEWWKKARRLKI